jgi:hypothetical protein
MEKQNIKRRILMGIQWSSKYTKVAGIALSGHGAEKCPEIEKQNPVQGF